MINLKNATAISLQSAHNKILHKIGASPRLKSKFFKDSRKCLQELGLIVPAMVEIATHQNDESHFYFVIELYNNEDNEFLEDNTDICAARVNTLGTATTASTISSVSCLLLNALSCLSTLSCASTVGTAIVGVIDEIPMIPQIPSTKA